MTSNIILVLIPHYNNLEGLKQSLSSISNMEPLTVLIVDDGSQSNQKPNQYNLQKEFSNIHQIICINNKINRGIEYVLNDGLKYAQKHDYRYIARLDCGDMCTPDRFKIQKEFLDENPDHYLVGSWVSFVDMNHKELFIFQPECTHIDIKKQMPIANQFCHPAVMFRTDAIKNVGYYPVDRKAAEDYAYFYEFVDSFQVANIPNILLKCELNPSGISLSSRKNQLRSRIKIILDHFKHTPRYYYSLLRNLLIYLMPYKLVELAKRLRS
jgi:glycosyltransferase involved in cell wall biosynthesis